MTRVQSKILPATLLGCILVVWFGTLAARGMPSTWQVSTPATPAAQAATQPAPDTAATEDACPLSPSFPQSIQQWCSLLTKYASDQLPVNLIAAVVLQESGGDPLAYSASGAVGLLQVMPSDGLAADFQCPNGPCFQSRPTTTTLLDPEYNLSYGTRMLAGLVNKYGNVRDALMHYGPANVGYYYADKVLAIFQNYR